MQDAFDAEPHFGQVRNRVKAIANNPARYRSIMNFVIHPNGFMYRIRSSGTAHREVWRWAVKANPSNRVMSPIRRRASAAAAALAILSLLLAACGEASGPTSNGPTSAPGDFNIVAYQGDGVLGGKQVAFKKVFDTGKPVVLNFWAGLCPPCRAEMPGFQKIYASLQDKVVFVGIDIGPFINLGSHDDAVKLYKQLGIQYPLAYAIDANPLQIYGIQGMPTTVFFSSKGQVVDQRTGILTEDQLRSIIQQKLLTS